MMFGAAAMKRRACALAAALFALSVSAAMAATKSTFVSLGQSMPGQLYEPAEKGAKARIAFVTIHPYSSFIDHSSCGNLAERGYTILCANTPWTVNQYGYASVEKMFPTIKAAIERLRKTPGVENVVLIGHSAAAPMMAYYMNVAQNGPTVCAGPEKLLPCDGALVRDLPKADGLVLLDPHLGDAFATLTYIDPAIADEAAPARRTKDLDLYDPANGFDPAKGRADYPATFRARFLAEQAARNGRLINQAQALLAKIEAKEPGFFADDMPFSVMGGTSARLWQPDTGLLRKTKRAHRLLKADGTEAMETLVSLRPPSGNPREARGFGSVLQVSVKNFLGAHALRTTPDYNQTEDDVTGVDWASSNSSTIPNVRGVTTPLLIEVMTAHYFLRPGEMILDAAGSADKSMVGIEGATHMLSPCAACGPAPAAFGDTVKRAYDYLDGWAATRF